MAFTTSPASRFLITKSPDRNGALQCHTGVDLILAECGVGMRHLVFFRVDDRSSICAPLRCLIDVAVRGKHMSARVLAVVHVEVDRRSSLIVV